MKKVQAPWKYRLPSTVLLPEANVWSLHGSNLAVQVDLQREENWSTRSKTLGIRLKPTNLSPRAEPRARSLVVGGATDDDYANQTSLY